MLKIYTKAIVFIDNTLIVTYFSKAREFLLITINITI